MKYALLAIGACAAAFFSCGCGTDAPGGRGLSPEQIQAVLDAAQGKFAELGGQNTGDVAAALVAFLKSRPEVVDASSGDDAVWAKLTDGTVVGAVFNRGDPPIEPNSRSIKPDTRNEFALPQTDSVRLINNLGTWFNSPVSVVSNWFQNRNYTVHKTDGSIEDLKNVSGDGLFYIDAHGGALPLHYLPVLHNDDGSPIPDDYEHFVLLTSTEVTQEALRQYSADLQVGNLVMATALIDKDSNGGPRFHTRFFITDRFIQAYHWKFDPGCLVFVNACSSNNDTLRAVCLSAGAGFYMGWTTPTNDVDAYLAADFFFDRVLGVNEAHPLRSPLQRPFSYNEVWDAMKRVAKSEVDTIHGIKAYSPLPYATSEIPGQHARGVSVVQKNAQLILTSATNGDNGFLMPSIVKIDMDEANDRIKINGEFGPEAGQVFVNGSPISATWGNSQIICNVPRSGNGSSGEIYVKVRGHQSNRRRLTAWSGMVHNHQTGDGTLYLDHTWTVRYRADVGKYRSDGGCDYPPVRGFIKTYGTKDTSLSWDAGGSNMYMIGMTNYTETWSHGPAHGMQYKIPSASSLTQNNFDFSVSIDPNANTVILGSAVYINDAYYDLVTPGGMAPGNQMPGIIVRSSFYDGNTYPPLYSGNSYNLAAGLNHYTQSVLLQSTFNWDAMTAEYPPDANAAQ